MKKILWIPLVGLVVAFVHHFQATKKHRRERTHENYQATWKAFKEYHVALLSTVIVLIIVYLFLSL